jgi:hypothetical protein
MKLLKLEEKRILKMTKKKWCYIGMTIKVTVFFLGDTLQGSNNREDIVKILRK